MCRRLVKMMHKAGGTGTFFKHTSKTIRLVNRGCTNRPFYHIVVAEVRLTAIRNNKLNSKIDNELTDTIDNLYNQLHHFQNYALINGLYRLSN